MALFIRKKSICDLQKICLTLVKREEHKENVGCTGNTLQIPYTKYITVVKFVGCPVPP